MTSTAVEEWIPVYYFGATVFWQKVCRCWVERRDTGGSFFCPYHGYVEAQYDG